MNKFLILLMFGVSSCLNIRDNDFNPQEEIQGNWLILYPQHVLKNDAQRKIYVEVQDSIVNLSGLKLVSFTTKGEFIQVDSLFGRRGTWNMQDTGKIRIRSAGRGFDDFKGLVVGLVNDTILVEEMTHINGEDIKLIWHLKRIITGNDASDLFEEDENLWRRKPAKKETDKEIKARVTAMLKYYSLYFKTVSKESIYFSPVRVFLPFTYYQHGVGLKNYGNDFANCFFDAADTERGYRVLKDAFETSKDEDFPSANNFVSEYALYFQRLAEIIK